MLDLQVTFPNCYDIKFVADIALGTFRGSLTSLSDRLGVFRDDDCEHQAGSDSKITAKCFFELKRICEDVINQSQGQIFGLSKSILDIPEVRGQRKNLSSFDSTTASNFIINSQFPQPSTLNSGFENFLVDPEAFEDEPNDFDLYPHDESLEIGASYSEPQKHTYLMIHPGLAAQLNPPNYQEMTLFDPY